MKTKLPLRLDEELIEPLPPVTRALLGSLDGPNPEPDLDDYREYLEKKHL